MMRQGDRGRSAPPELAAYPDVEVRDVDFDELGIDERALLVRVAEYCQAMVDADGAALERIVDPDATFTHMSGMRQSRDEFIADVTSGALTYYAIRVEHPRIEVAGDGAKVSYVAALNARAYGARGVYRMRVTHRFARHGGIWYLVDAPRK